MAGELVGTLLNRRSAVEKSGETWESSPTASSADASHYRGLALGAVPAEEWLRNRAGEEEEEDLLQDALKDMLETRGPRPEHAPSQLTVEEAARLESLQKSLADLQRELAEQKHEIGSAREDLAKRESEIRAREQLVESQWQRKQAQEQYPQPAWLESLDGTMNVAVVGNSGVGKSLLINKLRRLRPGAQHWAPVGVNETTMHAKMYTFPGIARVRIWDLPGAGTKNFPQETYIQTMGLRYFDSVLIVTAGRFTEMEIKLQSELETHRVPFFMVRSKVDIDVWNNKTDNHESEDATLQEIRDAFVQHGVACPYLVSSRHTEMYDMRSLVCDAFPGLDKHMDAIEFMFPTAETKGGWNEPWALPAPLLSPVVDGIQGQWMDMNDGTRWLVDGNDAHVTLADQRTGVVHLVVHNDGRVSCIDDWHIDLESVKRAKESCELRWTPSDLSLKPLVWRWCA